MSGDVDAAFGRSELDCILDQIPKHLLQTRRITPDVGMTGLESPNDLELLLTRLRLRDAERMIDQSVNIGRGAVQFELAVHDSGQVEQVIDQERFEFDVALQNFQVGLQLVAQIRIAPERGNRHQDWS